VTDFPENLQAAISASQEQKAADVKLWDLCLKFLEGNQHLTFDRNLAEFVTSRATPESGVRATINMLLNVYRNILAKLRLAYPGVVVLPASPSTEDITKAKSSETALRYYWVRADLRSVLGDAIKWLITCGTAGLHTYYDPNKDQIMTRTVSPYDLFFEPDAYPDFEEDINDVPAATMDIGSYERKTPENSVEVYEIHWRDGRHAVMVGGVYLYQDDSFPIEEFPIQVIKYTDIPRRLWGLGLLTPLVDLQ
jgi:hypothetical protein